jgi:hypothetical protein
MAKRKGRSRTAGAAGAKAFHDAMDRMMAIERTDWEDLDPRWEDFIERALAVREAYRRLTPRWRRELHPMVHEGAEASVHLAEMMILRRMHLRLRPIDPESDRELVIAEFRAAMAELERLGPFMEPDMEARRVRALADARQVDDVDLFPEVPGARLDRLVLLDGRVGAGASHRAASR